MNKDQYRIYSRLLKQGDTIDAELFKLTIGFTMADWRQMRTPAYWQTLDAIPLREKGKRLAFRLQQTQAFIDAKKNKRLRL